MPAALTRFVFAALLLAVPVRLAAQGTAALDGTVRSQRGDVVAGALVSFEAARAEARTDARGRFRLEIPAGTAGALLVTAAGFSPARLAIAALAAGARHEVALTLSPLFVLDAVTVVARRDRPLLNTEDAATGGAIEAAQMRELPTDSREPLTLLYYVPGVAQATGFFGDAPPLTFNGANGLYTQYFIDGLDNNEGFLGGPRVEFPLAAISRSTALANTYGAGFGRSSNGIVNFESTAGTNETRGELFGYYRPGTPFDASPKIVQPGTNPEGFRRFQVGGALGGPIRRDRTFAFGTVEYSNEIEDRIESTALTGFNGREKREKVKAYGRIDHGWSPTQTTTLSVALSDVRRAGLGSGVTVPEADVTTRRIGSITGITHRSTFRDGKASNTASVQLGTFRWFFPPTESDFNTPRVNIFQRRGTDLVLQAVVGSSSFVFDETERQLQLRDVFETQLGSRHVLRAGADLVAGFFRLTGAGSNPKGTYYVINEGNIVARPGQPLSITDIPANVTTFEYDVDARPAQVNDHQALYGAFVEDRFRVSPSLTLQAGVRWDYDDLTSRGQSSPDLNNIQPRTSFNWYATPVSVVRGGFGIYTGKLPYTVLSDARQFGPNGNVLVAFTGSDAPAYLQGKTPAQLQGALGSVPPREIRTDFPLGLRTPYSYQASLGYQRQLGDDWAISVDGVWVATRDLPRLFDLNAVQRPITPADSIDRPASFGDQYRPVTPVPGSYRRLTSTVSGGRSNYIGLYTTIRRRLSRRWSLDANWVWSKYKTDTEDINFAATGANNDFAAEYAYGVNDRRHKVALRSVYTTAVGVRVGVIADFQTGQPVNRIAFNRDLNGSGDDFGSQFTGNADRFYGVPRNGERLPATFELSSNVTWQIALRASVLELRADVFNVLNSALVSGIANGIPGGGPRTQVGRPGDPFVYTAYGRPRQVQFSARYAF